VAHTTRTGTALRSSSASLRSPRLLVALLVALPAAAAGQVESHCLPETRPAGMLPSWVLNTPAVSSRQVSAPLAHEKRNQGPWEADDSDIRRMLGLETKSAGRADARSLSTMMPEARRVVEQARSGTYRAAAEAGDRLLRSPPGRYGDYTWDYVAGATAWSHVQLGQMGAAAAAHDLAAARISDTAVAAYHRVASAALKKAAQSPGRLKDPAAYRKALREQLVDRYKVFHRHLELAKSVGSAPRRIANLQEAYKQLRVLLATDADFAQQKALPAFREAADTLCTEAIPDILDSGRQIHRQLSQAQVTPIKGHMWVTWVRLVNSLWDKVREAKRVCRIHDYLRRMGLASSRESERLFREANGLLFTPGSRRHIWNPRGGQHGPVSRDIRKVIPCDETQIRPM